MELIRIENKEGIQTVNARDLWKGLESKQKFADWIKDRTEGFDENKDFIIHKSMKVQTEGGREVKRPVIEYFLSLDTGKHIAMLERNEKGRIFRQYFIDFENIERNKLPKNISDARLDRLEAMTEKLLMAVGNLVLAQSQPKQIDFVQDYFTIKGYSNKIKQVLTFSEALSIGRAAGKLSREKGFEIRKAEDERFGVVNSYHINILNEVFTV
jgi:anti-repressor protein